MPEQEDTTDDESITTSYKERWQYIGTILSALMLFSLALVTVGVSFGALTLSGITQSWFLLYAFVTLMAATWTFGKGTLEAVQKARGK